MLMPAAVVVMLVLGAICVDLAVVHLATRNLSDVAASAANDAVTFGLDQALLRTSGDYTLDDARVNKAVWHSLDAHRLGAKVADPLIELGPATDQVTVTLEMRVDYLFAKALPGANGGTTVRARATATAARR